MNRLVIVLSGRKQSGKDTSSNFITAKYLNRKLNCDDFKVDLLGNLYFKNPSLPVSSKLMQEHGCKQYSFADPLKEFCINVFNVPYESCYGTDDEKNKKIPHLIWDNLPVAIRPDDKTGTMSGRELMEVLGTDICRKIYSDCWAVGTYNLIRKEQFPLAIIKDCRFPNELELSSNISDLGDIRSIRLLRNPFNGQHKAETSLDTYPLEKYDFVLANQNITLDEHFERMDQVVDQWFNKAGFIWN